MIYNKEKFVPIRENDEYLISKSGKLFSTLSNKLLKPGVNYYGYYTYGFMHKTKNSVMQTRLLHRLVAQAFIPNPDNKPFINHIDGNKKNNNIKNLEWCTPKENTTHAWKNGLLPAFFGEYRPGKNISCDYCKKEFYSQNSDILAKSVKQYKHRFCSRNCYYNFRKK